MNTEHDLGVGYFLVVILHLSFYQAFRNQIDLVLIESFPLFIGSVLSLFSFILDTNRKNILNSIVRKVFILYLVYLALYIVKIIFLLEFFPLN